MRILSRYFLSEFFQIFAFCQVAFYAIYLIIDFLQKIDNFIEAEVQKGVMLTYFLYKSPFIVVQMTPVASMMSVIILFCLMKKNNEITALRASGLSVYEISKPIITASLLIAVGLFLLSEIVVPYASSRSNEIWAIDVEKRDPTRFYGSNQIWYRGEDAIYWIRHFDVKNKVLDSPSFYFFDNDFQLIRRIDARNSQWEEGKWVCRDGIVQTLTQGGGYLLKTFSELTLELPETPETFTRIERKPEEMSYWQLKAYAAKVRKEGYDDTKYIVDMHIKMALPLVSLILVLSGIPIALGLKRGGAPLAVSAGMGVCFGYLLILGFSRSLGLSGTLPPFLSAWIAGLIFTLMGVYLMMRVER